MFRGSNSSYKSPFGPRSQLAVFPSWLQRPYCSLVSTRNCHFLPLVLNGNSNEWWCNVTLEVNYAAKGKLLVGTSLFVKSNKTFRLSFCDVRTTELPDVDSCYATPPHLFLLFHVCVQILVLIHSYAGTNAI